MLHDKIQRMAGAKAVYVTGDFNFQPDSEAYSIMTKASLSDSRRIAESEPVGPKGTFNSFRYGANHEQRIDFIFVNKKVNVKNYSVIDYAKGGIYPSDHFPVIIQSTFK